MNKATLSPINDINFKIFDEICDERFSQLEVDVILVTIIDNLPSDALAHLAEQYHITGNEGWIQCQNDDEKRDLIKRAIEMHRFKGTKYALMRILDMFELEGKISEWFETDDEPYTFTLDVDILPQQYNSQLIEKMEDLINEYKNVRSWMKKMAIYLAQKQQMKLASFVISNEEIIVYYSLLTEKGLSKINNALINNTTLNLKYIAVGDGNGKEYEISKVQESLVNECYRTEILEIDNVAASIHIPETVGGFYIREIGLFDEDNDLILIAKQPETYKPIEIEGSVKQIWIKVIIEAINPDVIELKIDPNVQTASVQWVTEVFKKHKHLDLMPIGLYDSNGSGVVDTCEIVDGGTFSDGADLNFVLLNEKLAPVMCTNIYDKNQNGITDQADSIDGGAFEDEETEKEDESLVIVPSLDNVSLMNRNIYDTNNDGIVDKTEKIDAGEF